MCFSPVTVKKRGEEFTVGCGKCGECISKKRMEWRQRLYFQNKSSDRLYFCTFTYDDAHLPYCLGFAVPRVSDIQKFHKRLRRHIDYRNLDLQFKYFLASEYGPKHFRPHYHGLYCVSGRDALKFPKIVRQVYNYGFLNVSLCRNRDASTSYITNYLTQTKGNPYFGKLPNAKYPASYLTRIRDEHSNGCVSIRNFDTFYLFSQGLGQKYFQTQIAPIIIHNLKALLKETASKGLNIVRIISQLNKEQFTNVNTISDYLQVIQPYENAIFHIYQNKDYSFFLLTRSYRRTLPLVYNILATAYARCSYLYRDFNYSLDERRLLAQNEEIRQAKIRQFSANFDKKCMRTDLSYTFQS